MNPDLSHNALVALVVRLEAKLTDRERRIRLARKVLDARVEPEDRYGQLLTLLDLRRPVKGRR